LILPLFLDSYHNTFNFGLLICLLTLVIFTGNKRNA
jgi:hypothetical protein